MNPTHMTKEQVAIIRDVIKASVSAEKAETKLAAVALDLVNSGITVECISRGGKYLADMQRVTAQCILTKAEMALWSNDSLATAKKGPDGKQVLTPKGNAVGKVNSRIKRVRTAMLKALAKPKPRGKAPSRRSLDVQIIDQCDAWIEKIRANKDDDKFKFGDADPIAALAALRAVVKAIKG